MNNQEAADLLYTVCEKLNLDPETLKCRVLSGWTLRPPASIPRENCLCSTVDIKLDDIQPMTGPWLVE